MKGKVNARREAVVRIQLLGKNKVRKTISAVIDTGYTGSLSLPPALIKSLPMQLLGKRFAELADGRMVMFNYYSCAIVRHGRPVAIEVDESPSDPLIGMRLLEGYELNIRVRRNGAVTIRPLP